MRFFFNKTILLLLLLFVLISIFVLNSIILEFNYQNKTLFKDICQQFQFQEDKPDWNYSLTRSPLIKNEINSNNHFVNISDNIFIYSAFVTTDGLIVLIGFAKNNLPISEENNYYNYNNSYQLSNYRYFCAFDQTIVVRTEATIEYLPESHYYYYSAIKVQCRRPKLFDPNLSINKVKLIETKISKNKNKSNNAIESQFVLIANSDNQRTNLMQTDHNKHATNLSYDLIHDANLSLVPQQTVVCVRPFYGNLSAINLLEFIAYYRSNGIDKIVFYNAIDTQHMSDQTRKVFDLLSSVESVEVLPFLIPNNDELRPIIHANGQLVSIHDCLYRFNDHIQIHVDFDEFLVVYKYKYIKQFLLSQEISRFSALVIPMVLFCNEFNPYLTNSSDGLLISNFNRQKTVWPNDIRSKVIIMRPRLISQMGIHNVWKLSPFYKQHESHPISYLKSDQALVYHYRKCCLMIQPYFVNIIHFKSINDYIVRDETMSRFIISVKRFIDYYIRIIS